MVRKSVIRYYYLDKEAQEILPYNPKRISATIVSDLYSGFGNITIGNTAGQAEIGANLYLYYHDLIVHGINAIWGAANKVASTVEPITVIEIIEE